MAGADAHRSRCGIVRGVLESASFRLPVARDPKGRLVPPEDAVKGRRYACPSCSGAVVLHAGEKKRRHFHHHASACAEETVLHLAAKELIVQAIEAWANGEPSPVFVRRCADPGCEASTRQPVPKKVKRAVPELRVPSGHVVDVGLLGPADLPIAAIEVLFSHEVDGEKAFELGLPWIEVDAATVCETGGRILVAVRDRFLPWLCPAHEDKRGQAARETRATREQRNALVRALPYRLDEFPAYRIAAVVTCPYGHETLLFAWDGKQPPWPRPPHVVAHESGEDALYDAAAKRLRSVAAFRRRWASACIRCGARIATPRA